MIKPLFACLKCHKTSTNQLNAASYIPTVLSNSIIFAMSIDKKHLVGLGCLCRVLGYMQSIEGLRHSLILSCAEMNCADLPLRNYSRDMRMGVIWNRQTCKTVLNLLETIYLRLRKIIAPSLSSLEWTTQAAMYCFLNF